MYLFVVKLYLFIIKLYLFLLSFEFYIIVLFTIFLHHRIIIISLSLIHISALSTGYLQPTIKQFSFDLGPTLTPRWIFFFTLLVVFPSYLLSLLVYLDLWFLPLKSLEKTIHNGGVIFARIFIFVHLLFPEIKNYDYTVFRFSDFVTALSNLH